MTEPTRVLVVDDERFFRDAIRDALADAGIPCRTAESGEQALEALAGGMLGVVVLDIQLTKPSGIEVLRELARRAPALRVIVVSSHTHQEDVLEALRTHACDYLAKPLHDEELVLAVRRGLAAFELESRFSSVQRRLGLLHARLSELDAQARERGAGERRELLADAAARAAADVLGAGKTSLLLLDEDGRELIAAAVAGRKLAPDEMDPVPVGREIAGVAVARGEVVVVHDLATDARFAKRSPSERYDSRAFAVAPIAGPEGPIGALCATDREGGGRFGEEDVALLRFLAREFGPLLAPPAAPARADAAEISQSDVTLRLSAPPSDSRAEADAELVRRVCEVMTTEVEPERIVAGALRAAAESLGAAPVALHLLDGTGELRLEGQWEADGPSDRTRLPRTAGLTGNVLQTGRLVAAERPSADPRFDPEVDTASDGAERPFLCAPLLLRGKPLGVLRAFPKDAAAALPRTGELLSASVSAAIRNVLLYRSLLDSIEDLAKVRRESQARGRR